MSRRNADMIVMCQSLWRVSRRRALRTCRIAGFGRWKQLCELQLAGSGSWRSSITTCSREAGDVSENFRTDAFPKRSVSESTRDRYHPRPLRILGTVLIRIFRSSNSDQRSM